jgi:superfamily II DNA/RNA helicase
MQTEERNQKLLSNLGIPAWNNMQVTTHAAIPNNKDVVLLAPTGSGKTLAFLVPVLERLKTNEPNVQCLILAPSRELVLQIEQVWKKMSTGFKVSSFYGGHAMPTEIQSLSTPPALLIGTPGRIADHISRNTFSSSSIHTLVLDEFDKSLALGFEDEMSYITSALTNLEKRILVSATAAVEIPAFTGITDPKVLDFISEKDDTDALSLKLVVSEEKDKIDTLFQLLCSLGGESALIFCNHREAVERTSKMLEERGIDNAFFHGGMEQMDRELTLTRFRNGSATFLVATDLAARGLDIPAMKHVIHYHLSPTEEEFTHRNGRTARMHATGTAYLIVHKDEPLPDYLSTKPEILELPDNSPLPPPSVWSTLYISGGKKEKLNKVDIVGFFSKIGKLAKEDLGLIEVKDFVSFAAVKKKKVRELLANVREQKMKGKKYRIAVAK